MLRRELILLLPAVLRAQPGASVRGRLSQAQEPPCLVPQGAAPIQLDADDATWKVLRDARLRDSDFEANGEPLSRSRFRIAPIHERALFVWRGGRKLIVTYWCAVCAIRAWAPGPCQCCQDDMALDLRDPALKDTDPSD